MREHTRSGCSCGVEGPRGGRYPIGRIGEFSPFASSPGRIPCDVAGNTRSAGVLRLHNWFASPTSYFAQDDRVKWRKRKSQLKRIYLVLLWGNSITWECLKSRGMGLGS